jgi:hypothetical protein
MVAPRLTQLISKMPMMELSKVSFLCSNTLSERKIKRY